MSSTGTCWQDSPHGYGVVSRCLHWGMAVLFAWQFVGAVLHAWDREAAVTRWFWSSHGSLGAVLLALVVLRGIWGLASARRRPPADPNIWGRLSSAGHLALYALMLIVPVVAMLRTYGRGKGFAVFGVPVLEASGQEIPSLMAVGNALHGLAGWLLLALVAGHVAMVAVHQYVWRDGIAGRMLRRR
ncbi:cytochrome b [Bordetella petrii]|uniref:cytochrome b n=1 Tax=Bordetella petrii TaxID=94624 RepID=UPI003730770D